MHIRKPLPEELPGLPRLRLATIATILIATLLIVLIIMPAERGVDPTGIGSMLGLTRMARMKLLLLYSPAMEKR